MFTRRHLAAVLLASIGLAACGGRSDDTPPSAPTTKGSFTAVVSFGDSLSDVGSYTPATSVTGNGAPPYIGGRFTTNGPGAAVWVEILATSLGLAVTPAEVGFNGSSVKCPAGAADATLAHTCTAYGQGGARVTEPLGIGNNGDGTGALTVPVVTQMANHFARFGNFKSSDLVLVYAGNNDVFVAFAQYVVAWISLDGQVSSGAITAAEASTQLTTAQQQADAAVRMAATQLAAAIKTQILDKGGLYVAVMTLNDIGDTPFGQIAPTDVRAVLTSFSQSFNASLREGLADLPLRIIDTYGASKEIYANPTKYGFVNNTTPACDAAKISALTGGAVTSGSSLFCNDTPGAPYNGLVSGADPLTWQFADDVHPTTGGHRVIEASFAAALHSFGWI